MKTKKKLSAMSAEEFMEHGFDSDVSDEEVTLATVKKPKMKPKMNTKTKIEKSESVTHKKQMGRLQDKDPEFFKFLQKNDEGLLEFSASEDEDEDENDGEQVQEEEIAFHSSDEEGSDDEEDDAPDMNDEEDEKPDDEEMEKEPLGKVVTSEMVDRWKESLKGDSMKALRCVFKAFRSSVENVSPEDDADDADVEKKPKKRKSQYVVEGGQLFNTLVALCFKNSVHILDKHLNYVGKKKSKRTQLPSSSKQWSNIKTSVKQYLMDVLQLLRQLTDASMLAITLRHCQALCPYYACFPKITKMLLKRLVRMWSSGDEHVRVLAFLCIRKVSLLLPSLFEYSLKNLYLAFVRNSKFVNLKTRPTVMFMRNSLVEMFALNESATYKHAFVYIRQLAIHLRNAITIKKKDGHQAVYNWQYISCLLLWLHALSDLYGDILKPLVYPVVQITLGVIGLIPAARYYPLRFQCLDALNYLAEKTGVYIPVASYVLEAIESKEFLKKPKSSEKPPDFMGVLKLSKAQLQTKGFQDVTIDRAFGCLLEHYVNLSNSIAFPELIFPICHRLKHLAKNSKVFKLNKDMKALVDKLHAHAEVVTKARSVVSFSPKDVELVRSWELQQKEKKNALSGFYETWKRMKTIHEEIEEENEIAEAQLDTSGKKRKAKPTDKDEKVTKPAEKKKKNGRTLATSNQEEDIVEDYTFSSDDNDSEGEGSASD